MLKTYVKNPMTRKRISRFKEMKREYVSFWILLVFLVGLAVIFIAFARQLIGLFSSDPEVVAYGVDCLRYVSYGYGFYAYGMVMVHADPSGRQRAVLRSLRGTETATGCSLCAKMGCRR